MSRKKKEYLDRLPKPLFTLLEPLKCMATGDDPDLTLIEIMERNVCLEAIHEFGGNQKDAADYLQLTPRVFNYILDKYKLRPVDMEEQAAEPQDNCQLVTDLDKEIDECQATEQVAEPVSTVIEAKEEPEPKSIVEKVEANKLGETDLKSFKLNDAIAQLGELDDY